ncbi:MAG: hypothetical protein KBS96_04060 [Lachnospiraceae bacterium]|nr:hypothetical protein [Candidatus Colinaster scatohippi]
MKVKSLFMFDESAYSDEKITIAYNYNIYSETAEYCRENSKLKGVKGEYEKLNSEEKRYAAAIGQLINENLEPYKKLRNRLKVTFDIRKYFLLTLIASIVFKIIDKMLRVPHFMWGMMTLAMVISIIALPVVSVVYAVNKKIIEKFYEKYRGKLRVEQIAFNDFCKSVYERVDKIYLNSLDPTHRELVLMRRENQKNAEEARRRDKQMENLQKELSRTQRALVNEQKINNEIQQELLSIERRKEKMYGGYYRR